MISRDLTALALLFSLAIPASALADPADDLFAEGNAAFTAGQLEVARTKFAAAWQLKKSFDIAANLALVESKLSKKRDAAEHLDYALRHFPAVGDKAARSRMESDLSALQAEVARVHLDVPDDTNVTIDDKPIGRAPFEADTYVEPGSHHLVAEHPKLGSGERTAVFAKSVETNVTIDLHAPSPGKHPSVVPALIAYGVGVVGLGIGAGFMARAGSQLNDARVLGKGRTCAASDPTMSCVDISGQVSKSNTSQHVAIGGFAVAGAGVAVGTGLLVWALTSTQQEAKTGAVVRVDVGISPSAGGVSLMGAF